MGLSPNVHSASSLPAMWPRKCPVTSSRLSYLSYKIGLVVHVHKLMQRSSVTQDIKVLSKKVLCKVGTFLELSRRSQEASRDSSLPSSDSFLFHSLAFYSAKKACWNP